ncbi:MAG: pyridoxamine 5'-phosphate oxidase family protein [Clostridia bacterium]|nr:pyridoxamine 5'-phosphate oxidase family protein [Clostridia bacterium]
MFREVQRKKQALAPEECAALLQQELRGVLSVIGDDGYPYALPVNHWYDPEDGKLYFHSGKTGHKIDAMRQCEKACFCVYDGGSRREGEWALDFKSVVVFGKIDFVEDHARALEISRRLSERFTDDTAYIDREIEQFGAKVLCFSLTPLHITGKRVNEA